jgi:hypothetical protein
MAKAKAKRDEIRIAVWQFVRIMVALEGRRPRAQVYDDWKAAWHEIDRELTRLGKSDHAAYSDLMMNQEVVLILADDTRRREVAQALSRVIRGIKGSLSAAKGDAAARDGLKFELAELAALNDSLNRDSRSSGRSG